MGFNPSGHAHTFTWSSSPATVFFGRPCPLAPVFTVARARQARMCAHRGTRTSVAMANGFGERICPSQQPPPPLQPPPTPAPGPPSTTTLLLLLLPSAAGNRVWPWSGAAKGCDWVGGHSKNQAEGLKQYLSPRPCGCTSEAQIQRP